MRTWAPILAPYADRLCALSVVDAKLADGRFTAQLEKEKGCEPATPLIDWRAGQDESGHWIAAVTAPWTAGLDRGCVKTQNLREPQSAGNSATESIYRHCVRLTNYFNRHDEALDLSNVKRLGTAPRAGRIGLPPDAPQIAVNIDCTAYYGQLTEPGSPIASDQPYGFLGMQSHSWYFGNLMFTKDLFSVLIGQERTIIPTRAAGEAGIALRHV
jgi:hypothetical protein